MSRCCLARVTRVVSLLQRGFNLIETARQLEVSRKTVVRDIQLLQDRVGYRIEYNYATERWEVEPPKERVL